MVIRSSWDSSPKGLRVCNASLLLSTASHPPPPLQHVGGNHRFQSGDFAGADAFLGIHMGCRNKRFTENYELTSLCCAHGCQVKPFEVNTWVEDGALLYLDDADRSPANTLQIIYTPGHTMDSVSVYHYGDRRLFIGDLLYPFTAVSLSAIGSNMKDYFQYVTFGDAGGEGADAARPGGHSVWCVVWCVVCVWLGLRYGKSGMRKGVRMWYADGRCMSVDG